MMLSSPLRRLMASAALAVALGAGAVTAAGVTPAAAQTIDLATGGDPNEPQPIEVLADDGIEWVQDEKRFIARGNAVAIKGDTQVFGDVLTADYRERPEEEGGGTEIYNLTAEGNVRIESPQETATGNRARYDVDNAVLYLWGAPAKLVTPTDVVTADDEIRYYEVEKKAIAEGDAIAVRGDRRIRADVLTAFFEDPEAEDAAAETPARAPRGGDTGGDGTGDSLAGDSELDRIYGDGAVVITTPQEVAEGDKGNYNAKTGIAELEGSVKITREKNVLTGNRATTNLNTGISTMHSGSAGKARGLLVPNRGSDQGGS
ncbi:LptA/OstA family protein [Caenispirillum salinarum]|uniref:LptA/OstA family protein n=1 Tax=Caenispirillum salinarum TaxID=859058 RepID=UPI003850E657